MLWCTQLVRWVYGYSSQFLLLRLWLQIYKTAALLDSFSLGRKWNYKTVFGSTITTASSHRPSELIVKPHTALIILQKTSMTDNVFYCFDTIMHCHCHNSCTLCIMYRTMSIIQSRPCMHIIKYLSFVIAILALVLADGNFNILYIHLHLCLWVCL